MSNYSKTLKEFTDVTVTGQFTQASVVSSTESIITTATLDSSDSGRIFFLNLAGGFTVTLPPVQAGLGLKFIVATAPTTDYILDAGSAIIHGAVTTPDVIAVAAGDSTSGTATATIHLVASKARVGDTCELVSDGTSWFANCVAVAFDGAVFT